MDTREAIINLIENIHDEDILKGYVALIKKLSDPDQHALWKSLSSEEKDEIIIAFEESYKAEEHIAHKDLRKKYAKWLESD